jgi:galactoside O-acetyltransferase
MEMFSVILTNSVVFPGVTLAEGSVLGACSMLTKDAEPWTIYVGIPARPLKVRKKDMKEKAKILGYEVSAL